MRRCKAWKGFLPADEKTLWSHPDALHEKSRKRNYLLVQCMLMVRFSSSMAVKYLDFNRSYCWIVTGYTNKLPAILKLQVGSFTPRLNSSVHLCSISSCGTRWNYYRTLSTRSYDSSSHNLNTVCFIRTSLLLSRLTNSGHLERFSQRSFWTIAIFWRIFRDVTKQISAPGVCPNVSAVFAAFCWTEKICSSIESLFLYNVEDDMRTCRSVWKADSKAWELSGYLRSRL